jgi:two-component system response regulator (stage 0 sporulation protein A)
MVNEILIQEEIQRMRDRLGELESMLSHNRRSVSKQSEGIYQEITMMIRSMGVPANLLGYRYMREAILLIYEDQTMLHHVTKELYPMVARKHMTAPSRVERAIRHAIEVAWNKPYASKMNETFGCNHVDRPTNSAFLAELVDQLVMKNREGIEQ